MPCELPPGYLEAGADIPVIGKEAPDLSGAI
jgi:hypothetical protein